jgi:uncharacterized protein (TIGR03435 family)
MESSALNIARKFLPRTVAVLSLMITFVYGGLQATATSQTTKMEGRQWKFSVVSIRKDIAGGPQHSGVPTADGYQMQNVPLGYLILMAYVPQNGSAVAYTVDQLIGLPAWLAGDGDRYDVYAKVDEADLADWHDPAKEPVMLRSMLQAMLKERLKLVVHRSTKEAPVYRLVVGKNGPKFKETNLGELHPGARPMPGGGLLSREQKDDQLIVHYFGISVPQLARFVLGDAGRPVQDKTNLTGKYDVVIQRPVPVAAQPGATQDSAATDPGPPAASVAEQLGLKLVVAKEEEETLVIDYVEPPSPN